MTETCAPDSPEPRKVTIGSSVGVAGACSVGAAGTCVSITNDVVAAALMFPAPSCCVAETACVPSASGDGGRHDQAPPAATVAWQSIEVPCATVTTAAGSPVPEKRMLVLRVGLGTDAMVGLAI